MCWQSGVRYAVPIMSTAPDLDPQHPRRTIPAGMRFERFAAADGWPLRSFVWPQRGSARGSILFLGGRGDFVEKYLEALGHWHDSGWTLAGFDWRGQGGSGRFLADRTICHAPSLDPLLADLDLFLKSWIARSPAPHVIVAHSMGAHLVLRRLARDGAGIDAVVLSSPMVGIAMKRLTSRPIGMVARAATWLGHAERRIWRGDMGDVGGRMTSCPERREDKLWWKATCPEIATGSPSWGWVAAACRSIAQLPMREFAAIDLPVLAIVSEADPIIDVDAVRRAAATLPRGEIVLLPGTGHELLREADARRLPVLARIDAFLSRA